ncbi:NMD4 Nonsense-mediated decay protein 4 [Candida maltosa Xu316]
MSLDLSSDESERYFSDELVDSSKKYFTQPPSSSSSPPARNVKRWFNEEYINANATRSNEIIDLNIYIPAYTLHEFDFVKKGTSISATNAREAIRFIDNYLENEVEFDSDKIRYNLTLETPSDNIPSWNRCMKYKIHSPKIKEFPNYKTKFDSSLIGQTPLSTNTNNNENDLDFVENFDNVLTFNQRNKVNDIQYENSQSYQNAVANSEQLAEMPVRLRYLIRTCIFKRFIESNSSHQSARNEIEEWKLVTEDSITKIWAKSFGIDCLNVNEAELLIFQNYDVNSFKLYNPYANDKDNFDPRSDILQNTIDTTLYNYSTAHQDPVSFSNTKKRGRGGKRGGGRGGKPKKDGRSIPLSTDAVVHSEKSETGNGYIKKEKFGAINYAPRGRGELWKPS